VETKNESEGNKIMKAPVTSIIVFMTLLGLLSAPLTISAHEDEGDRVPPPPYLVEGDKAPDFSLTDQAGKEFRLKDLQGKPVFITFIYTSCPDVCPLIVKDLGKIEQKLWWWRRNKLQHLAITVDPEVDTPVVLDTYARRLDLDSAKIHLLTGKPREVTEVLDDYRIKTLKDKETGTVAHPLLGYLIDEDGKVEEVIRLNTYMNLIP
jgi:cytochrome oxidase Cu insertion factor (SCO1/SenC/PrrC family)